MEKAQLRLIDFDDIQLLRYWRNLDHIRNRMVSTDYIARDGQRNWFNQLDKDSQRYYIFSFGSQDVGSVNITKIDYDKQTFEAGVFCGNTEFRNHWINVWACIKAYDYAFFELDLQKSFATILSNNETALKLNKTLGYEYREDINKNVKRYLLTREIYVRSTEKIKRYLQQFANQEF